MPTKDWEGLSELNFGRLLLGKLSVKAVESEKFIAPYNVAVKFMKGKFDWTKTDVIDRIGFDPYTSALEAAGTAKAIGDDVDWYKLLEDAYLYHEVSNDLESAMKRLRRGMEVDVPALKSQIDKLSTGHGSLVRMIDVQEREMNLVPTGYAPIDHHVGGIPEAGLTTVLAPPKTGKTTLVAKIISCFAHRHKTKKVFVVTREMIESHFKKRVMEVDGVLTDDDQSRIIMNHDAKSVHIVATLSATISDLGLVVVDFADLLISGTVDPSKMEEIYRVLAMLASDLSVPVILIAQLSRNYGGGLPRPFHARWTGMAEALTWMFIVLYVPWKDNHSEKEKLFRVNQNKSYIGFWMCRSKTNKELPGLIETNWTGEKGWSNNKGTWISLDKSARDKEDEEDEEESMEWTKKYA